MACDSPFFNVLLIDDQAEEATTVRRILSALTTEPTCVDHVTKSSAGVGLLNAYDYDLVLLDNRLSDRISAEFSAPFIRSARSRAPIAIISGDINLHYLRRPEQLGVDYIIDKADLVNFLRDQLARKQGQPTSTANRV